ncbi:Uncharacterized protein Rs2_29899 [Raphanus sativus]|nr:Uncharacterized protein Rs2_29899 [Raphanus sativus]
MVSISIYSILDESPFVEREENREIYREIYGDPIYDIYEDDVCVVRAKFGRDEFCAKFGRDDLRAKSGRDEFRAKYGQNHIDEDFVKNIDNLMRANFVQDRICEDSCYKQIRAKIVQNMLLKIRGRVFLGKSFGFKDYKHDSRANLLQPEENDIIGDLNEFKKTLILGILRLNKIFVIILVFRVF